MVFAVLEGTTRGYIHQGGPAKDGSRPDGRPLGRLPDVLAEDLAEFLRGVVRYAEAGSGNWAPRTEAGSGDHGTSAEGRAGGGPPADEIFDPRVVLDKKRDFDQLLADAEEHMWADDDEEDPLPGRKNKIKIPHFLSITTEQDEQTFKDRAHNEGLCSRKNKNPALSFGQHWKWALALRMMEKYERRIKGTKFERVLKVRPDLWFPVEDNLSVSSGGRRVRSSGGGVSGAVGNEGSAEDGRTDTGTDVGVVDAPTSSPSSPLFRVDFAQLSRTKLAKNLTVAPICGAGGGGDMVWMAMREAVPVMQNLWRSIRNCKLGTFEAKREHHEAHDGFVDSNSMSSSPTSPSESPGVVVPSGLVPAPTGIFENLRTLFHDTLATTLRISTFLNERQPLVDTCDDWQQIDKMVMVPPINANEFARFHVWRPMALRHGVSVCNCAGFFNVSRPSPEASRMFLERNRARGAGAVGDSPSSEGGEQQVWRLGDAGEDHGAAPRPADPQEGTTAALGKSTGRGLPGERRDRRLVGTAEGVAATDPGVLAPVDHVHAEQVWRLGDVDPSLQKWWDPQQLGPVPLRGICQHCDPWARLYCSRVNELWS